MPRKPAEVDPIFASASEQERPITRQEALLLSVLERDASAEDAAEVQAMLENDPRLARLMVEMDKDRQAMHAMPAVPPPPGMIDDVLSHLERRMLLDDRPVAGRISAGRRLSWTRAAIYTGAAAALALTVTLLWDQLVPNESINKQVADLGNFGEANPGGKATNPGSEATVNPEDPNPIAIEPTDLPAIVIADGPAPAPAVMKLILVSSDPDRTYQQLLDWTERHRFEEDSSGSAGLAVGLPRPSNATETGRSALDRSVTLVPFGADRTIAVDLAADAPLEALVDRFEIDRSARVAFVAASPVDRRVFVTSGLGDLTGAARMAHAAGLATATGHGSAIQVANYSGMDALLDHASFNFASGADLGWALAQPSPTRTATWITDTPAVTRHDRSRLVVTIRPTAEARLGATLND